MSTARSKDEGGAGATSPDAPSPPGEGATDSPLRSKIRAVAVASAAGLVVSEAITLLQVIAIARLLSPAEVGIFAAGTVLVLFLTHFAEGGLRAGLVHREDQVDDAAVTVFWATFATGVGMGLVTLASSPLISSVFDSPLAGTVAAAMSGSVALYSLSNVPEALLQRRFNVRRRVVVGPSVSLSFAVVSVSLAAAGWGVWSLVAASYASTSVYCALVWWLAKWRPTRGRASLALWRELARYGAPLVVGLIADQVVHVARAGVVGHVLGSRGLGLFRYGERIARLPVTTMVEVGSYSLFPALSRIRNEPDRLRGACLRSLRVLSIAAGAMSFALVSVGTPLVVVVLGEEWREAGTVLVGMAGVAFGTAVRVVAEETMKGVGATKDINVLTAIETTLGLLLLVVLIGPWGLLGVGVSISLTAVITAVVAALMMRRLIAVTARELAAQVLPSLWSGTAALAVTSALERLLDSDSRPVGVGLCFLALDGAAFVLVYGGVLRVTAPSQAHEMLALLRTLARRARRT